MPSHSYSTYKDAFHCDCGPFDKGLHWEEIVNQHLNVAPIGFEVPPKKDKYDTSIGGIAG